ncbi:MAG: acetate--CoA ligase family protein [Candidatus Micrarchaeota archaeon]
MLFNHEKTMLLLKKYGIKTGKQYNCKNLEDAVKKASKLKPPLVLKVLAENVFHKTEKKLIALDLHDENDLVKAFHRLDKNSIGLKQKSFLLQEELKGAELIVGARKDPSFGNIVLYGSGGIFAELFKDTAIMLSPITRSEATKMISSTKSCAFFGEGFRGRKASREKVIELLLKTSKMIEKERIESIDFNPVIATQEEALIVDAKIVKK